ncbi:uncharacterized protein BDZ99DRAFT_501352 [Mytilinidion resinicola]|uniref:Uncharacterized protein n=1 Tax=Mytilinidion resinicola TaxID=574789 RepID=A0A6A6YDD6_9PEZI|nr:uncharacterized protein BDZ99DRAFT_501352 [Mytilinidion resinicola]KAF2806543.1 hypothetical protein BDZ99DRAFT_501352 [Mytilinidion resinicola]
MAMRPAPNFMKGGKPLSMMRPDGEELEELATSGHGAKGKAGGRGAKGKTAKTKSKAHTTHKRSAKKHQPTTANNTSTLTLTNNKVLSPDSSKATTNPVHQPIEADSGGAFTSNVHGTTSNNNRPFTLNCNGNLNNNKDTITSFPNFSSHSALHSIHTTTTPSTSSTPHVGSPTNSNRYTVVDPNFDPSLSVSVSVSASSSSVGRLEGPTMQGLRDHRSGWNEGGTDADWVGGGGFIRRGKMMDSTEMEMQYAPDLPSRYVPPSPPASHDGAQRMDVDEEDEFEDRAAQRAYHSTPPPSEPGSGMSEGAETVTVRRRMGEAIEQSWAPVGSPCPPPITLTGISPPSVDEEAGGPGPKRRMSGVSAHLTECSNYDMISKAGTSKSKKSKRSKRVLSPPRSEYSVDIGTAMEVSPRLMDAMASLKRLERLQLKDILADMAQALAPFVGGQLNEAKYVNGLTAIRIEAGHVLNFLASIICNSSVSGKKGLAMESLSEALGEIVLLVTKLWGGQHEDRMDLEDPSATARNVVAYEKTPMRLADLRTALTNLLVCMTHAESRVHRSGRLTVQAADKLLLLLFYSSANGSRSTVRRLLILLDVKEAASQNGRRAPLVLLRCER